MKPAPIVAFIRPYFFTVECLVAIAKLDELSTIEYELRKPLLNMWLI